MKRSPGRRCLCSHAWTRHRQAYGEPHTGACRDCVCEVFEADPKPVEAPVSAPQLPAAGVPPARDQAALSPEVHVPKKLEFHPAADLFPMLSEDELDELAADIKANGQKDKITLLPDGRGLDGRNRLEACRRAGVEPKFETLLNLGESPTAWVLSKNLKRRHLKPSQTAMIAADAVPLFEKEAKERQRAGGAKGGAASKVSAPGREASAPAKPRKVSKSDGKSAVAAAAAVGAAARSVERAKALKEKASPAEIEKIRTGEKTLKQVERETKRKVQTAQARVHRPPEGQFEVIAIDPPWPYEDTLDGSDAARGGCPYPTMTIGEICGLQIPVAENCAVHLWVTNSHLIDPDAYAVVARAWRIRYGLVPKQVRTWRKTRMGLGRVWRNITEHLVRFERGRPVFAPGVTQTTDFEAPAGAHSEKPQRAYDDIEAICASTSRLEMFARDERKGWAASGSELPKKPKPMSHDEQEAEEMGDLDAAGWRTGAEIRADEQRMKGGRALNWKRSQQAGKFSQIATGRGQFYRVVPSMSGAQLFVADIPRGDFRDVDEAKRVAAKLEDAWTGDGSMASQPAPEAPKRKRRLTIEDKPGDAA